tara:strand:+ start:2579 stop:2944 length:366 start_codon:yes stop_codon:yes gene_type:complete
MFMNVFSFIRNLFENAIKLVDGLCTTDEERLLQSQTAIITAKSTGQSWIQRNWRPITMLTFLAFFVMDSFAWLPTPLAKEAWILLQIGLGSYVSGLSAEKITRQHLQARPADDKGTQTAKG